MFTDREALRLRNIIDNIDRIDRYVTGMDLAAFAADAKTVDAVERCLQRITEAVVKIGRSGWRKSRLLSPSMRCAASATCCGTTTIEWT